MTDDHETSDIVCLNGTGVVRYGRHTLSVENLSSSEKYSLPLYREGIVIVCVKVVDSFIC